MMYNLINMGKQYSILFVATILTLTLASCKKHSNNCLACGPSAIISKELFESAPQSECVLQQLKITGDCLTATISASGCDGNSWVIQLIDIGEIAQPIPPVRKLRISLENKEICDAYITKEVSFYIKNVRIAGSNKLLLNVSGKSIEYDN